jgi:tetratricopeptide (TPR) repeat protein
MNYTITTNPLIINDKTELLPELTKEIDRLYYKIRDRNNTKVIQQLNKLIEENPGIPILKNYLSSAYKIRGNHQKAEEINSWALREHPDYLFARLNEASICIENNEFDKALELLGEQLDIQALYPERNVFHISEATNFLRIVVTYLLETDRIDLAEEKYNQLIEIDPDTDAYDELGKYLTMKKFQRGVNRWTEENKNILKPKILNISKANNNAIAPVFEHPEIEFLYQFDLSISHQILGDILALPRQSLISDLEKVLDDAVNRYGWFCNLDYSSDSHSIVIHALHLLRELKACESLPKILSFLEYDFKFLDFWLGDHITDSLWHVLYDLGQSSLHLLREFLFKPGIDTYPKLAVSTAISEMAIQQVVPLDDIEQIYSELFSLLLSATTDDNLIDSEFNSFAISDAIDCKLSELQPLVKELFDKGIVSHSLMGNYNEVEKYFDNSIKHHRHNYIFYNIFDYYNYIVTNWYGYTEDDESLETPKIQTAFNAKTLPPELQQIFREKTGRNDPCPCGSGKKYKKCCWEKEL